MVDGHQHMKFFKPKIFVLTRAGQRRDLPVNASRVFAVHCQICTPPLEPRSPKRYPFKTNRRKPFGASEISANVTYTEIIDCFEQQQKRINYISS